MDLLSSGESREGDVAEGLLGRVGPPLIPPGQGIPRRPTVPERRKNARQLRHVVPSKKGCLPEFVSDCVQTTCRHVHCLPWHVLRCSHS